MGEATGAERGMLGGADATPRPTTERAGAAPEPYRAIVDSAHVDERHPATTHITPGHGGPLGTVAAATQATQAGEGSGAHASIDPRVRERLMAEFREQAALERFQAERPDLWLHAQRVGKLMELQQSLENAQFPPGSCFLHAGLPDFTSYPVKQVLEIDLDTCLVTVEIHGDSDLEAGIVLLPLEAISWYGFPARAVQLNFTFQGFTGGDR